MFREGEYGDVNVSIEDHIIGQSLEYYRGPDRDKVTDMLYNFGLFPEDVPVPAGVFDMLAESIFGARRKKPSLITSACSNRGTMPNLQVRSWLQALSRMALVLGDFETGFYTHDIVRHFARSYCEDTQGRQRRLRRHPLYPGARSLAAPPLRRARLGRALYSCPLELAYKECARWRRIR